MIRVRAVLAVVLVPVALAAAGCGWFTESWSGEMTFRVVEPVRDANPETVRRDLFLEREPGDGAVDAVYQVGSTRVARDQAPPGTTVGDRLVCRVRQERNTITTNKADAATTIGPCRAR